MKSYFNPFFRSSGQTTVIRIEENTFMIGKYFPGISVEEYSNTSSKLLDRIEVISYQRSFSHPEGVFLVKKKDSRICSLLKKCVLAVRKIVAIEILLKTPSDQRKFKEREIRISKESRLAQLNLGEKEKQQTNNSLNNQKIDAKPRFVNSFQLPLPTPFWKKRKKPKERKEETEEFEEEDFTFID